MQFLAVVAAIPSKLPVAAVMREAAAAVTNHTNMTLANE